MRLFYIVAKVFPEIESEVFCIFGYGFGRTRDFNLVLVH